MHILPNNNFIVTACGRRVRHGVEFCHPRCPEYTPHVGTVRPLPAKLTGKFTYNLIYELYKY